MNMKKVVWVLLLALMLAACSNENGANSNGGDASTGGSEGDGTVQTGGESETDGLEGFLASKDPLELTIHMHYWDRVVFEDDWEVFQEASELTNVSLRGTAPRTASNSEELLNLVLSSGDMADVVVADKPIFHQYGMDGAFLPLNELIQQHAPNLRAYLDEHPNIERTVAAPDGNLYYIPFLMDGEAAQGWFIREDWLEELGLDVPNTKDEFYEVLKAFRDNDPNRNNQRDEIPFFSRQSNVNNLLGLWNARPSWDVRDGSVYWGPAEEEYKQAMIEISQWYSEGLIDREIFTRGNSARDILLGDNVGGVTNDWFASTAAYNMSLSEQVQGFSFKPMAPPANTQGERIELTSRPEVQTKGWAMSHSNQNPVETIRYFDFWFTEEGRRLANFGVEGLTYTLVDGKPQFTDEILNGDVRANLGQYGVQLEFGFKQDFDFERQWMNEIALEGVEMYIENGYPIEQFPLLTFTPEEQRRIDQLRPALDTYLEETVQRWVLGVSAVEDNHEAFLRELDTIGLPELLNIHQAAYDRFMNL